MSTAAGDVASARASAGAAAARLDGLRDADLADDLSVLWYLGWAEVLLERFDAGLAHLRRGVAVSPATGRGDLVVPMLLGQARSSAAPARPGRRPRRRAGRGSARQTARARAAGTRA